MKQSEIKKELHRYIDEADEPILNILHDVLAEYANNKKKNVELVVPMTKEAYESMIKKAGEQIKRGEVHTEEEVSAHLRKKYAGKL